MKDFFYGSFLRMRKKVRLILVEPLVVFCIIHFQLFLDFLNEIYRKFSDSIIVARFLMEFDGKIKYDEIPPSFFSRQETHPPVL
jgi:hypothetical protein